MGSGSMDVPGVHRPKIFRVSAEERGAYPRRGGLRAGSGARLTRQIDFHHGEPGGHRGWSEPRIVIGGNAEPPAS